MTAIDTDRPTCACRVLSTFERALRDILSDDARQRLLAPLVPRLAEARSAPALALQRSYMALDWLIRVYTPAWLDLQPELAEHAAALRALPEIVDLATAGLAGGPVRAARSAATSAAWAAARAAAWSAESDAESAAWAAAESALQPTVERLQASAVELLDRMITVQ